MMTSKEEQIARNKKIQDDARKIIDGWPDWKKAYVHRCRKVKK